MSAAPYLMTRRSPVGIRVSTRAECPGCHVWFTSNCLAAHQRKCCPGAAPPKRARYKAAIPMGHRLCAVEGCARIVASYAPSGKCYRHQNLDPRMLELDAILASATEVD